MTTNENPSDRPGPARKLAAWLVHALTASGAVWGVLALVAIADGRLHAALGYMAVTVAIDGVDGWLARRVRVATAAPQVDGALLDNLVDYLNYAVVPAFLVLRSDLLPPDVDTVAASAICLSSAYQFSHRQAKVDSAYFRGFPSYWNIVAFYLLLLELPPWWAAGLVGLLAIGSFAPVLCLYPSRTPVLRMPTLLLTAVWAALVIVMLVRFPNPRRGLLGLSLLYVFYYVVASGWITLRHRPRAGVADNPP